MKVIIVEDESKSRQLLENLLTEYCPQVQVIAKAATVKQGIEMIRQHQPDLVFLDIEMQSATGFDLLEQIGKVNFEVIFTTAYEQYAIKAIKFSALDYLLKPIDVNELIASVEKAAQKKSNKGENELISNLLKNIQTPSKHKITLTNSDGVFFIDLTSIIRCEASGAYTTFLLKEGKQIVVSRNIKEYEQLLSDHHFFRMHNSHLVNLNEVEKYVKSDGGYVVMKDGSKVSISNSKKEEFLALTRNM